MTLTSCNSTPNELLIVMTPHVVKNRYESEMIKQVESARMNWCLSDVVNLHGPAGLRSQTDRAGAAEAETVYPDQLPPEALLPLQPTEVPQLPVLAAPSALLPEGLPEP